MYFKLKEKFLRQGKVLYINIKSSNFQRIVFGVCPTKLQVGNKKQRKIRIKNHPSVHIQLIVTKLCYNVTI